MDDPAETRNRSVTTRLLSPQSRQSLGDQWDPLFRQGRSMTSTQVFDLACEELDTID